MAFDGGYGQLPWLLQALDGEGERFLAEVHADQAIYPSDPSSGAGEAPRTVTAWAETQPAKAWRRMKLRDGEKGEVVAEFLTARVFVWDKKTPAAKCWHLLVRREIGGTKLKFCLSNAKAGASLRQLVAMQASRHFVERAFEDAKGAAAWRTIRSGAGMAGIIIWRW